MTAQQRNLAEILAALVVLIGGYLGWRGHERSLGALQVVLHASDSTAKAGVAMAAKASTLAATAVQQAEVQHDKALQQLAASEALRKSTEEAVRQASAERDSATKLMRDSAATAAALWAEVGRLVASGRADSIAVATERVQNQRTTTSLLATIQSDSTALAAEQAKSRALQSVTAALQNELSLMKQSKPSAFGNIVRGIAYAGGGYVLGRAIK